MNIYCDDNLVYKDQLANMGSTCEPFEDASIGYNDRNNFIFYSCVCDIPMKHGIYTIGFDDLPVEETVELGDSHFFAEEQEYDCLYYECNKNISIERGQYCRLIIAPVLLPSHREHSDCDDLILYKVDIWILKDNIGIEDLPKR